MARPIRHFKLIKLQAPSVPSCPTLSTRYPERIADVLNYERISRRPDKFVTRNRDDRRSRKIDRCSAALRVPRQFAFPLPRRLLEKGVRRFSSWPDKHRGRISRVQRREPRRFEFLEQPERFLSVVVPLSRCRLNPVFQRTSGGTVRHHATIPLSPVSD